ncbi:MAG: zinc metallopeptidase [Verrucomicrobia bacterium]|nr:zinc metallopeptidase [Verrucomicrobiota bacterium]
MLIFFLLFALALMVTLYGRSKYRLIYDEEIKNLSPSGLTGEKLARRILDEAGIEGVEIVKSVGLFADFYDPSRKRLSLAPQHFAGSTYSALGVAAHEVGHAIQQKAGYHPLKWRITAVKASMYLTLPVVVIGTIMTLMTKAVFLLIISWTLLLVYNLFTMPIELDASERSKKILRAIKPFANYDERVGVEKMMRVAPAAYIEGLFTTLSWVGSLIPSLLSSDDSQDENKEQK